MLLEMHARPQPSCVVTSKAWIGIVASCIHHSGRAGYGYLSLEHPKRCRFALVELAYPDRTCWRKLAPLLSEAWRPVAAPLPAPSTASAGSSTQLWRVPFWGRRALCRRTLQTMAGASPGAKRNPGADMHRGLALEAQGFRDSGWVDFTIPWAQPASNSSAEIVPSPSPSTIEKLTM